MLQVELEYYTITMNLRTILLLIIYVNLKKTLDFINIVISVLLDIIS